MRRSILFAAAGFAALLTAGAASAQSISVGQTVSGTIAASDPQLSFGENYDCWVFSAPAAVYTVDLRSEAFDAYLTVGKGGDCNGEEAAYNDDWGDGLDSHVEFRTDGGPWFIMARPLDGGELGAYDLSLVAGGDPANMEMDEAYPDDGYSEEELDLSWMDDLEGQPGGEEHIVNVLCAAVDTLDLIMTMENMTEDQMMARIEEGARFTDAANLSGSAFGFSVDDVENQIANLGATLLMDPDSSADFAGARQECLAL